MKKIAIIALAISSFASAGNECQSYLNDYNKDVGLAEAAAKAGGNSVFAQYAAYYSRANAAYLEYIECQNKLRFDAIVKALRDAPAQTSGTETTYNTPDVSPDTTSSYDFGSVGTGY